MSVDPAGQDPDDTAECRQLELGLLAELSELLASEHGPVPEKCVAEARGVWLDDE